MVLFGIANEQMMLGRFLRWVCHVNSPDRAVVAGRWPVHEV